MSEDASLWVLFASSFLAATVLPGGSEAALVAVLRLHPDSYSYWPALAVATLAARARARIAPGRRFGAGPIPD